MFKLRRFLKNYKKELILGPFFKLLDVIVVIPFDVIQIFELIPHQIIGLFELLHQIIGLFELLHQYGSQLT